MLFTYEYVHDMTPEDFCLTKTLWGELFEHRPIPFIKGI